MWKEVRHAAPPPLLPVFLVSQHQWDASFKLERLLNLSRLHSITAELCQLMDFHDFINLACLMHQHDAWRVCSV
jgi:hypothetical protein